MHDDTDNNQKQYIQFFDSARMEAIQTIIIIGSGPAGLTAAIYAARANLSPILISGPQPGGQLTITTEVENFPGFSSGIMGPKLMDEMKQQAKKFGTQFIESQVSKVDLSKSPYTIYTDSLKFRELKTHTIIISSGATAKLLGLESEARYMGHGISACATCDGFFFKKKELIVVGGGDSAMEEANFLTKFASKVTVIHRRDQFRCSKIMLERAQKNPKIEFITNVKIEEFIGNGKELTGVLLKDKEGKIKEFPCQGAFIAIGHQPNSDLFKGQLELDEVGYIITKKHSSETNLPGVFACGDVQDSVYRQAITAAGTGCMAAIDAERYLEGLGI